VLVGASTAGTALAEVWGAGGFFTQPGVFAECGELGCFSPHRRANYCFQCWGIISYAEKIFIHREQKRREKKEMDLPSNAELLMHCVIMLRRHVFIPLVCELGLS
jgi:hypothetical protein